MATTTASTNLAAYAPQSSSSSHTDEEYEEEEVTSPSSSFMMYGRHDSHHRVSTTTEEEKEACRHQLDSYFMNLAMLYSKRRKNVKHQAGACIVDSSRRVVGIGNYKSSKKTNLFSLFNKETPACNDYLNHAEVNAIQKRQVMSLDDCTMYVTSFPCVECSKLIAQSGIRRLVYMDDHTCQILTQDQVLAAQVLLGLAKVEYTKLVIIDPNSFTQNL